MRSFIVSTVCALVVVASSPLVGSGKQAEGEEKVFSGGSTPEQALAYFADAMLKMDKKGLLASCKGSITEMKVVAAMADFGQAVLAFKKKFIEAYGERAWKDFQDPMKGPKRWNARLNMPKPADVEKMKTQKIKMKSAESAEFTVPNSLAPGKLAKVDGKWFVVASSLLPPRAKPKAFVRIMLKLAGVVAKYQKAIGHDGISAVDIDAELGRAIAKNLLKRTSRKPHIFDIDKIK